MEAANAARAASRALSAQLKDAQRERSQAKQQAADALARVAAAEAERDAVLARLTAAGGSAAAAAATAEGFARPTSASGQRQRASVQSGAIRCNQMQSDAIRGERASLRAPVVLPPSKANRKAPSAAAATKAEARAVSDARASPPAMSGAAIPVAAAAAIPVAVGATAGAGAGAAATGAGVGAGAGAGAGAIVSGGEVAEMAQIAASLLAFLNASAEAVAQPLSPASLLGSVSATEAAAEAEPPPAGDALTDGSAVVHARAGWVLRRQREYAEQTKPNRTKPNRTELNQSPSAGTSSGRGA